ncbi:MAG: hypothetical protein E7362_05750 [Clostridiales bacterium]|nr:hypothetical protein [Clostridiales bacterium]
MVLADGIILGLAVLFLALGVITGFGKGLEIISKGIFGKIFSLVMCYFFIGLVIKIPAISGLMESFVTTLQENGAWWANILLAIRVDIIAVVAIMLVVITFLRILVVQLVKNIFESDNIVMEILNKTLGAILFLILFCALALIVFQIIYWIGGETATNFANGLQGSFMGLDAVFYGNPINALVDTIRLGFHG